MAKALLLGLGADCPMMTIWSANLLRGPGDAYGR
jgi:hypothetical protein